MMSAYPMMERMNPTPKRVDVDMEVSRGRDAQGNQHRVINWIDPNEKVLF